MKKWRQRLSSKTFATALFTGLCFALASGVYLAWLGRLVELMGARAADWLSMVAGYLFQAIGCAVASRWLRRQGTNLQRDTSITLGLFALVSTPALLTDSSAALLIFGWLMNLLCGCLGGLYLYAIAVSIDTGRRGVAFGSGYAAATVIVGLLALVGGGILVRSGYALLVCLIFTALAIWAAYRLPLFEPIETQAEPFPRNMAELDDPGILRLCMMVALISAVKNLGFSFPSADIQAGLIPQLSRLPYAIGLAAAGYIIDRKRANGMICTLAALALPFIMLGLLNEPLPSTVFWGLDYVFYGFFSVFRVILFIDVAARLNRWELAPLGLLAGRLGDAAGTAVTLLLAEQQAALIALCIVAFIPAVFLLLRQFQALYEPSVTRQRNEQEVFDRFCLQNDLSAREQEVLRMLLSGHSNAEIADALFISENTVKYHVRNVLQKTGCKNRYDLQRKFKLALYPDITLGTIVPIDRGSGDTQSSL